jgi:hypothetical protein
MTGWNIYEVTSNRGYSANENEGIHELRCSHGFTNLLHVLMQKTPIQLFIG